MQRKQAMQGKRPYRKAGAVIVAASTCWGVGISFVGMVHATKDPATRLAMLQRSRGPWIAGQFLAAAKDIPPFVFYQWRRPKGAGKLRTGAP